jgi:predicted PurR-regulated permease PerM
MATARLEKRRPRQAKKAVEVHEEAFEPLSQYHHDLIVRYCLLGIFILMAVGTLYVTKVVTLPLATGILFGMVLGPVVDTMAMRGLPQQAAAALIVAVIVAGMVSAAALLALPVASWSDQIPAMLRAIQAKFTTLFDIVNSLWHVSSESGASVTVPKADIAEIASQLPLFDIAMTSSAALGGLLVFVATVYFYLATRRHLKARVLRLCLGREARRSADHFFVEIEHRVATYLGFVTVINLVCGLLAAAIAWTAGLSYPIFWGAVAFVLNYLVFIGPAIVAVMLFAAGLLAAPTLLQALWPPAAYLLVHLLEGNVVTPTLVGHRLTMSPFLVFVSFVFWLWLWGPVGAVLATPILIVAMAARETFEEYKEAESAD